MTHAFLKSAAVAALSVLVAACTMKGQDAPSLTGPSEFAQSITVSVSPDVLFQDGASQSLITVQALGPNGEPLRLSMRAEIEVGGVPVDFGSLSARNVATGADGRATFVYTAPSAPLVAVDEFTIVEIVMTPIGTDFNNSNTRRASIRLVPPGRVISPDNLQAAFTVSPPAPLDSQDVFFDASASTGDIVSYSWDFGDGDRGSGRTQTHSYDETGVYHPTLTITDSVGRTASATETVTVTAGANPTAGFVFSPTAPRVNQNIAFNASASRAAPGQQIVSYTWDFGDGTGPRAGNVAMNYTYATAGTYSVTLVVTDSSGKIGSITVTVAVLP
jgi:PKD repeat protein